MTCAGNQVDPGGLGPDFIGGVKNVTVPEGRDVILSCTVVRLGTHKVRQREKVHMCVHIWVDRQLILILQKLKMRSIWYENDF